MAYFFLVERGPRPGLQLAVPKGRPQIVGRGSACDLPLPAEDRAIGLRHTELWGDANHVHVTPLPQGGMTLVNGERVNGPASISPGDSLQVDRKSVV